MERLKVISYCVAGQSTVHLCPLNFVVPILIGCYIVEQQRKWQADLAMRL
jgi:hypothetical protein